MYLFHQWIKIVPTYLESYYYCLSPKKSPSSLPNIDKYYTLRSYNMIHKICSHFLFPSYCFSLTWPKLRRAYTHSELKWENSASSDVPVLQFLVFGRSWNSPFWSSGGSVFFAFWSSGIFSVFLRIINHWIKFKVFFHCFAGLFSATKFQFHPF